MQMALPKIYDPALQYCIPAARRVAGTAPPSRCKLDCMRLLAQQTCRGPAPKLIPKDCSWTAAFGFGYALEYLPLSVPVRSEDPCTGLEPGASSPQPIRPPRKETKLRPNKTRPPDVRGESP